jgi:hypothetical protein
MGKPDDENTIKHEIHAAQGMHPQKSSTCFSEWMHLGTVLLNAGDKDSLPAGARS